VAECVSSGKMQDQDNLVDGFRLNAMRAIPAMTRPVEINSA
jgi:hypothetical protein